MELIKANQESEKKVHGTKCLGKLFLLYNFQIKSILFSYLGGGVCEPLLSPTSLWIKM